VAQQELPAHVIARARQGDHQAFRQVVERYQAGVFKLAYHMTGSHAEATDLTQETFLRVHRFFGSYDPKRPLTPWLYRVATNVVLSHAKPGRPAPASLDAAAAAGDSGPAADGPGPPDAAAQREAHAQVRAAVASLRPNWRAAVTLYYLDDLSLRDVAEALCVPQSTAKVWLFRARRALRDALETFEL